MSKYDDDFEDENETTSVTRLVYDEVRRTVDASEKASQHASRAALNLTAAARDAARRKSYYPPPMAAGSARKQ